MAFFTITRSFGPNLQVLPQKQQMCAPFIPSFDLIYSLFIFFLHFSGFVQIFDTFISYYIGVLKKRVHIQVDPHHLKKAFSYSMPGGRAAGYPPPRKFVFGTAGNGSPFSVRKNRNIFRFSSIVCSKAVLQGVP